MRRVAVFELEIVLGRGIGGGRSGDVGAAELREEVSPDVVVGATQLGRGVDGQATLLAHLGVGFGPHGVEEDMQGRDAVAGLVRRARKKGKE